MEKRNHQQFKHTSFWKEEDDNILFWDYCPLTVIDIEIAKELVEDRLKYSEGKALYSIADVTNLKSVTKDAREYMSSPDGGLRGILGGAFLSNSIVNNMVVNLYLKMNKPSVPAKFFTKKEDAVTWVRGLKKLK
jgi:hypothetical protein